MSKLLKFYRKPFKSYCLILNNKDSLSVIHYPLHHLYVTPLTYFWTFLQDPGEKAKFRCCNLDACHLSLIPLNSADSPFISVEKIQTINEAICFGLFPALLLLNWHLCSAQVFLIMLLLPTVSVLCKWLSWETYSANHTLDSVLNT